MEVDGGSSQISDRLFNETGQTPEDLGDPLA
jgi:hypothetical protein